ncbi:acyltransferase domain-containing protein [Pseudomonas sp. ABY48]|uniref:acyltransferase domain-containing protein n=1 Tax=Pseudomonas sp. ABY48 TaxID=3402865 RepID=UPI003B436B99
MSFPLVSLCDNAVFMFPGQGNDPRGGLATLHRTRPQVAQRIETILCAVDEALNHIEQRRPIETGLIRRVLLNPDHEGLLPVGVPQMAAFTASVALAEVLELFGVRPRVIIAQSLGEIAAMVSAGALTLTDGVRAICALNNAFQDQEGTGTMVLVGGSEQETLTILERLGRPDLVLACVNTPRQCLVSGPNEAIEALMKQAPCGARLLKLDAPYASHHPALGSVAQSFLTQLRALSPRPLRVPLYSCVARRMYHDKDDLLRGLADCVVKPAHLLQALQDVESNAQTVFVDLGIGDGLSRCVYATLPQVPAYAPLVQEGAELMVLFHELQSQAGGYESPEDRTVRSLVDAIEGGISKEMSGQAAQILASLDLSHRIGMDNHELHRGTYARLRALIKALPANIRLFDEPGLMLALSQSLGVIDPSLFIAFAIQYGLCVGTLIEFEQGNPGAIRLRQALESGEKVGAYMITEIGSSNSQIANRTEAVFDLASRSFTLHTPDNGALKFTNVGISDQAKIGVVCARLKIDGRDCGVYPFALDISDHRGPRPGGRLSSPAEIPLVPFDYGLAGFDHVQLPYCAWLSGSAFIDEQGVLHDSLTEPDERLVRTLVAPAHVWAMAAVAMCAVARASVGLALSHSLRRSTMARIGADASLLSYSTQRRALFGALATTYVTTCQVNHEVEGWMQRVRERSTRRTADASTLTWAPWSSANRSLALSKALCTWGVEQVISECRLRCGVAGDLTLNRFMEYQGLAHVFNDAGGNNLLIVLDTAKSLCASALDLPLEFSGSARLLEPEYWLFLFRTREYRLVSRLKADVGAGEALGSDQMQVWNPLLVRARAVGEAHGLRLFLEHALQALSVVPQPEVKKMLGDLTALFVLERIEQHAAWFISEGLLELDAYRQLEGEITALCDQLAQHTPQWIAAFGYPGDATQAPIADDLDYASALANALHWATGTHTRG